MNEAVRDIVCDTGPLIHLDELGCLDLLADFKNVVLSGSVVEEIENHRPIALTVKLPFKILPTRISWKNVSQPCAGFFLSTAAKRNR